MGMAIRWQRKIAAVLAAGMILGMTGCLPAKEALPEDTIEEYEMACNAMDVQAMLDCIDEKTVKSMTAGMDAVMGLVGAAAGVDIGVKASDLIDMAPLLQSFMGDLVNESGGMPQVDFQVKETYIKGSRATVYFTEANSGENMVVNMVKNDGKWYMTLSNITITRDSADRVISADEEEKTTSLAGSSKKSGSSAELSSLFDLFDSEKLTEYLTELLEN